VLHYDPFALGAVAPEAEPALVLRSQCSARVSATGKPRAASCSSVYSHEVHISHFSDPAAAHSTMSPLLQIFCWALRDGHVGVSATWLLSGSDPDTPGQPSFAPAARRPLSARRAA
jgi:hypothetical protein